MDRKDAFEQMLAEVDADKRDEAYAKLAAVETRAEKIAIFESYGVTTARRRSFGPLTRLPSPSSTARGVSRLESVGYCLAD